MTFLAKLAALPVHFYRYVISPLLPGSCRFQPTCSAYILTALENHGAFAGGWLGMKRILRCHPVKWLGGSQGYDPVPPNNPAPNNPAPNNKDKNDA